MKVFDATGKEVAVLVNENKSAGSYSVSFNGSNLSSGIYFYKLESGGFVETKRMVLLK
ncbi:MAG: T9SS type A sorting domain-containing protein [Ignavibacteria bacterium]